MRLRNHLETRLIGQSLPPSVSIKRSSSSQRRRQQQSMIPALMAQRQGSGEKKDEKAVGPLRRAGRAAQGT